MGAPDKTLAAIAKIPSRLVDTLDRPKSIVKNRLVNERKSPFCLFFVHFVNNTLRTFLHLN